MTELLPDASGTSGSSLAAGAVDGRRVTGPVRIAELGTAADNAET
ncbi:hypothetical protein LY13_002650 [Prauserella aidingensis]|nr:hypothetical protein [Prauserella aidingensis]MCP2253892.1 hypothetical protein [Prauserella aidingensis]